MAEKKAMLSVEEAKKKALSDAIAQIEKQFGVGSIMRLGESAANRNIEVIPTGCLTLDMALGIGGVPRGRVVEIYGPESSGKTTLTLHIIAEAQKKNGVAAFIDAEHALDPVYASKLGVNLDDLIVSQPDSGEQALEIVEALVNSGAVDVIVVDSVAALTPKVEIEGMMGDAHVGLLARLMSQALRKLTATVNKTKTCVIFINQLRSMIGNSYGPTETTTGGKALKFYASVRLDVRKVETLKDAGDMVGNKTKVKVVKNKLAPPFKIAEFDIMFGKGISNEGCVIDLACNYDIIEKSGSWFAYNGEKLGQGKENVKALLESSPELTNEIIEKIKAAMEQERVEIGKKKASKLDKKIDVKTKSSEADGGDATEQGLEE